MKVHVQNYTFDKTAKTVTFTDYTTIRLDSILLIVNVTTGNTIIYNFADSTVGGTVATNVLTLTYNTSSMNNADKLLIYYDDNAFDFARKEDSASADADGGIGFLAVRKATPVNTSSTDGDYEFLQMSAGRLWASATIDAALPTGSNIVGRVGIDQTTPGTTNLVALTAETTKVIGVTRSADGSGNLLTSTGSALDVNLKTSTITLSENIAQVNGATVNVGAGAAGSGTLRVTTSTDSTIGTLTTLTGTTSLTPGVAATNLGKAEDAVAADGDTGVMVLSVRKDTATSLVGSDGDYAAFETNARGAQWVAIENGSGGQITSFGGGTQYTEDVASTGGETVTMAGVIRQDFKISSTNADADVATLKVDASGALYTNPEINRTNAKILADVLEDISTKLDLLNTYLSRSGPTEMVRPPTVLAQYAPTVSSSIAYETSRQVKNGSGVIYSVLGYNSKVSAQFIQVFNSPVAAADGAIPLFIFVVGASSNFNLDFGERGKYLNQGIYVCNSSSGPTKTIGSADCWFNISYI